MIFNKRSAQLELLDLGPSVYREDEYQDCLHQLSKIGKWLGGDRITLDAFSQLETPQSILEVGCGGGHFTAKLGEMFPHANVLGIDLSSSAIAYAKSQALNRSNVQFVQVSSPQLEFAPNSFDILTTTLVCHHMDDGEIVDFLKKAYVIASKCILINDLHRNWFAYAGFSLLAKFFFANRLVIHDGPLSIKRSFKKADWLSYLQQAGIPPHKYSLTWHWPFRWLLKIDAKNS
ncbi:MAG: methyltransferase domain-containing protein [Parachlamydiaceae bacterium]